MDTSLSNADVQQILDEAGAPVIVFDKVQLAFDDKVVLRDLSFTLLKGHTKIILGASGSGKSTALKIITGLLKADAGVVWVNGQRVDQLSEEEMMAVRADLGMLQAQPPDSELLSVFVPIHVHAVHFHGNKRPLEGARGIISLHPVENLR